MFVLSQIPDDLSVSLTSIFLQIGACIVNTQNKVVGIGYNTMPYTPFYNNDQVFSWERICRDLI